MNEKLKEKLLKHYDLETIKEIETQIKGIKICYNYFEESEILDVAEYVDDFVFFTDSFIIDRYKELEFKIHPYIHNISKIGLLLSETHKSCIITIGDDKIKFLESRTTKKPNLDRIIKEYLIPNIYMPTVILVKDSKVEIPNLNVSVSTPDGIDGIKIIQEE